MKKGKKAFSLNQEVRRKEIKKIIKNHETRGDIAFDKPYEKLNESARGLQIFFINETFSDNVSTVLRLHVHRAALSWFG